MIIRGYAAVFADCAQVDDHLEAFMPGAFSTMRSTNLRIAHSHAMGRVLQWAIPVAEDDVGLRFEATLDPNNPEHRGVVGSVRDGTMTGVSPRYQATKSYWADGVEIVTKARLIEISLTGDPAFARSGAWFAGDEDRLDGHLRRLAEEWTLIDEHVWVREMPEEIKPQARPSDSLRQMVREHMGRYLGRYNP